MRYVEAEKLQDNPDWFDGHFINLPKGTSLKVKAKFDERTIRLSDAGRRVLPLFLKPEAKLPIRNTWDYILKQRAEATNLKPDHYIAKDLGGVQQPIYGICAKSTRKTLASWLVYYLNSADRVHVPYSMGHDKETESEHYLNMPFVQEDRTGWSLGSKVGYDYNKVGQSGNQYL